MLDEEGNIVWSRHLPVERKIYQPVLLTSDKNYLVLTNYEQPGVKPVNYLMKIDRNDADIWQKLLGQNLPGHHLAIASDGGIFMLGKGINQIQLTKMYNNGEVQWQKNLPVQHGLSLIAVAPDGNCILAGTDELVNKALVVKTDADGNFLWQQYYSGWDFTSVGILRVTPENHFLLYGSTRTYYEDRTWLLKADAEGNELREDFYTPGFIAAFRDVQRGADGFTWHTGTFHNWSNSFCFISKWKD